MSENNSVTSRSGESKETVEIEFTGCFWGLSNSDPVVGEDIDVEEIRLTEAFAHGQTENKEFTVKFEVDIND